ncbi:hypothetical protein [Modestobacter versicolor]|uniref:Uncharacterized protein n=1 Tax=Modestobacter versicolor TaxID=429133 RepID=A0A323VCB6_9ACTN|nr:hypothetical protein [Modestobacter versicolor]MBB3678535.1 hypothetical protein [Modestobacter versicolor]PZA22345.1 hypothetical protein DMO24_05485 [Modestobacter versicolor]
MESPEFLLDGSRREGRLVLSVCALLVLTATAMVLLRLTFGAEGDVDVAAVVLTAVSVMATAVALFVAYVSAVNSHRQVIASARRAEQDRLDAAAPLVSVTVDDVLSTPAAGSAADAEPGTVDVQLRATVCLENLGDRPALVGLACGRTGGSPDRGLSWLPARGTGDEHLLRQEVTGRVPVADLLPRVRDRAWDGHHDWAVTVLVHDAHRTVTDRLTATCRVRLFAYRAGGWTWPDAAAPVADRWARLLDRRPFDG